MKTAFLLVATLVALSFGKITITWGDCGTASNVVKIESVTWDPANPQPGDNVTITGTGTLKSDITGGTSTLDLVLKKHTWPSCDGTVVDAPLHEAIIYFPKAGCPLKAGNVTTRRYVWLSPHLIHGKTSSHLTSTDQNGNPAICLDVHLENE